MKKILCMLISSIIMSATLTPVSSVAETTEPTKEELLSQLIATDPTFPNSELIYSDNDKYKFDIIETNYGYNLIIYGFDQSECYSGLFSNVLSFNSSYTYIIEPWYPMGDGKDIWSGRSHLTNFSLDLDEPVNIVLYVTDEIPYNNSNFLESTSTICQYIHPYYYTGECQVGDFNGDSIIDSSDASKVLSLYAQTQSKSTFEPHEKYVKYGDVNGDGMVDSYDASMILAYYAYQSSRGTKSFEEFLANN